MGNPPHVLVIPLQAQGHLMPVLKFSNWLAKHDIQVTVINSDSTHNQIVNALAREDDIANSIRLVSCPNVYNPEEVKKLIQNINASEDDKITCVLFDAFLAWNMGVAAEMGIRTAIIGCVSAAHLFSIFHLPKFIEDGVIAHDGTPNQQTIQISPHIPPMNTSSLGWLNQDTGKPEKHLFEISLKASKSMLLTEWVLCNSSYDLDSAAFDMNPKILPIGPLLASNQWGNVVGNIFSEDLSCLNWLDQQATQSVIYVAFGSAATFDQVRFQEFATGLELSNRPFLWVIRPDIVSKLDDAYLKGFQDRMGTRGLVISWAPQQKVLEHPSIACFISHCGWNSSIEALSNGVPLLCCPFGLDQFYNEKYICNVWKVGLGFNQDGEETTIITAEGIKDKLDQLLGSENYYKSNALDLKEKLRNGIKEGGCSYNNFMRFVEWLKA